MKRNDIDKKIGGSYWFKRFVKDAKKISPHIHFKHIKHGYVRIYWMGSGDNAYIGECTKWMPQIGYDFEVYDPRLESRDYYEEHEDSIELSRRIKNFKEGYWDNLDKLRTRVYQMKHNKEHYKTAVQGYRQMRVR